MGCLCAKGRAWQNNLSVWRVNTVLKSGGHEASLLIVLRPISHHLSHVDTVSHYNVEVTKLLHCRASAGIEVMLKRTIASSFSSLHTIPWGLSCDTCTSLQCG